MLQFYFVAFIYLLLNSSLLQNQLKTLLKSTCQHLLLLVGFDTLTYRKGYDRSPTLVGHQDTFLTPLPGSVALLVSGIGKENFYRKCCFYFLLLFYFIMERQSLNALFGRKLSTTPMVEEEPPPTESIPFKIPMGILNRVMDNRYAGDGTVHPG